MWQFTGSYRPSFAVVPTADQESVWDYPRPPRAEESNQLVIVKHDSSTIARSKNCYRVLETASPPTFYIPPDAVDWAQLAEAEGRSLCEWKGIASYWALKGNSQRRPVGWSYADPRVPFECIRNYVAFYPGRVDCYVDNEQVRAQPGQFYGGWVTDRIVGPFKGEAGTGHW